MVPGVPPGQKELVPGMVSWCAHTTSSFLLFQMSTAKQSWCRAALCAHTSVPWWSGWGGPVGCLMCMQSSLLIWLSMTRMMSGQGSPADACSNGVVHMCLSTLLYPLDQAPDCEGGCACTLQQLVALAGGSSRMGDKKVLWWSQRLTTAPGQSSHLHYLSGGGK